ncbi:GLPGLI family protein [Flavicella sp.]|uniref:GLPGLI family protein n=1 Tax=Flavicella sp. TaxID=2957742 RepID=UPI00301A6166
MKLFYLITVFLFISYSSLSQEFQGKAVYMSKTNFDFDFGDRSVPEDAKKRMKERIDKQMQKNFDLSFNKTASIYEEQVTLDEPEEGRRGPRFRSILGGSDGGVVYKNIADKEYKRAVEFFGKNFLIEDPLVLIPWKLEKETKKIGQYTCYKATTTIDKKENPFAKNKDSLETKTIVIAWYTPEVPVSQGPGKYWGLPGLILSVNAGDTQIICTKVVLNVKEKVEIKPPKKGKKVSEKEFEEIVEEKTNELKERSMNGRPGGGRRPR